MVTKNHAVGGSIRNKLLIVFRLTLHYNSQSINQSITCVMWTKQQTAATRTLHRIMCHHVINELPRDTAATTFNTNSDDCEHQNDMFSRFDTVSQCDRQTDRQNCFTLERCVDEITKLYNRPTGGWRWQKYVKIYRTHRTSGSKVNTLCLKKCTNFETIQLKLVMINFDMTFGLSLIHI